MLDPPIKNMEELAALSGVSHSALSNWRKGKYRPSIDSLYLLAKPLQVTRDEVVAESGVLQVPQDGSAEGDWGERRIRESSLPPELQDKLVAIHREDMRRAREALEEKIKLLQN